MQAKQVGIGISIRIYVSNKQEHKRVNWQIRYMYIMKDVGLKYLHLSTDYETNLQSKIEACERHMAKEKRNHVQSAP